MAEAAPPNREDARQSEPVTVTDASLATTTTHALGTEAAAPEGALHTEPRRVLHDVASAVARRAEEGGGEVRLRLDPPELGHVDLHVRLHEGGVTVDVRAERPEAARLLQDHHDQLSSLLSQQGLDLAGLNVSVGSGGSQPGRDDLPAPRGSQPRAGEFASLLGIEPATATLVRLRAAYNPDGLHLFRV